MLANNVYKKYDLTSKRRLIQSFFLFLYFVFPLFGIFYFDLDSGNFVLLGKTLGLNNSVLVVVAFMILLSGVITMAITTGRSFCGWVCPQNFLSEIINKIIKKIALDTNGKKKFIPYAVITFATFIISLAVAINFMFYFGKPLDVLSSLAAGNLNGNVITFAIFFFLIVFAGIGIFRHDFCKYGCPYGIMQASVADKTTLRVRFDKDRSSDCINCEACTDVCYVDIEPRKLVQADPGCMNCGLCVEACHNILEPLGVKSMIDFKADQGDKDTLNNKAPLIMISTLICFIVMFFYMFFSLPLVDLTVTRNDAYVSVIKNDKLSSKYFIQLVNQSSTNQNINLEIEGFPKSYASFSKSYFNLEKGKRVKIELTISAKKELFKAGIQTFYISAYDFTSKTTLNKVRGSIFVPF